MSKFYNNKKILSFRSFDKMDGSTYVIYEFVWPVEVIECYANKVAEGTLDALAEAVLKMLSIQEMSDKKIAEKLDVDLEVVKKIERVLVDQEMYNIDTKEVTKNGQKYISDKDTGEFQEEKVFGNVFVSRMDGEVLPYFYEGRLPWAREYQDVLYLSYDAEKPSTLKGNMADLQDRVNKAFHKYGQITKSSKDLEKSYGDRQTIEFIQEELVDRSFDEEETLADVEAHKNLKNARIKILNTPSKEMYLRCRVCISKAAPEKFVVDSPFPLNITSWYSECFYRMRVNNQLIYEEDGNEIRLDHFCQKLTQQFYIDYPEMQSTNFEQFIKIQFPRMEICSISEVCRNKYKEIFNYNLLVNKGTIKRHSVITESAKGLELILNNYIHQTNKHAVMDQYKSTIIYVNDLKDMMHAFGVEHCSGQFVESKKIDSRGKIMKDQSIMSHFYGDKDGHSIIEKYYFLVAEAYFNEKSKFRKLLLTEGNEIVALLDDVNKKRNMYGAHNDGIRPPTISDEEYDTFGENFKKATRILIDYMD